MPRELHLVVRRHARIMQLGEPAASVRCVWIACHGYGQLAARFISRFEPIAGPGHLIVAPEALNRFYLDGRSGPHGPESRVGATWMTREDRLAEIDDYIAYLDRLHEALLLNREGSPARLVAFGFSQGVATICRWASRTKARVDELVLWAGTLPPELVPRPGLFGTARITLVAGERDEFAGGAKLTGHAAALRAHGMSVEELAFDGGHEIVAAPLVELARRLEARA